MERATPEERAEASKLSEIYSDGFEEGWDLAVLECERIAHEAGRGDIAQAIRARLLPEERTVEVEEMEF